MTRNVLNSIEEYKQNYMDGDESKKRYASFSLNEVYDIKAIADLEDEQGTGAIFTCIANALFHGFMVGHAAAIKEMKEGAQ